MAYEVNVQTLEVRSVDPTTMSKMTQDEYLEYLEDGLIYVDHHDVLRSMPAGYPLATTKAQLALLIAYLRELEPKVIR
jgi:hypothetical protein